MVRFPPWYSVSHRHICAIPLFVRYRVIIVQKNPRVHKNKIGTSPPPPPANPKYPPKKRGILWKWRFSCRKNAEIEGAHKIGAAISGPRIAEKNFTDTRLFFSSDFWIFKLTFGAIFRGFKNGIFRTLNALLGFRVSRAL